MNEDNRYAPPRAPVSVEDGDQELAGRSTRLAAAILDNIILSFIVWPYAASSDYVSRALLGRVSMSDQLQLALVVLIGFLILNGYLLHRHGQTIAKRLLGIRIVSAIDGQLVTLGRIFGLRYVPIQLVGVVPILGFILPIIDALFIFREDRRCLHDLIAGTKVVKVKS